MNEITGSTRVVALFGHPIAHSSLPRLVNAAFASIAMPHALVPFDAAPADLADAVACLRTLRMAGAAVAAPHKERVGAFLDELGPTSRLAGSVDTIERAGTRLVGHNTLRWSFLAALQESPGVTLKGKRVLLVGAGGTARSITVALLAEGVSRLIIANQERRRSEDLAEDFARKFPAARLEAVESAGLRGAIRDADLFINASPSGFESAHGGTIHEKDLHPALCVFDATPSPITPLLLEARRAGCATVSGVRMLQWQVFHAVRQWTGEEPPRPAPETEDGARLARSI